MRYRNKNKWKNNKNNSNARHWKYVKDPFTNTPVVVVERTLLYDCIPKQILNNLEEILGGDFEKIPEEIKEEYISKLKLIPFSSLGKQNGMLVGIKPEYVKINKMEKTK